VDLPRIVVTTTSTSEAPNNNRRADGQVPSRRRQDRTRSEPDHLPINADRRAGTRNRSNTAGCKPSYWRQSSAAPTSKRLIAASKPTIEPPESTVSVWPIPRGGSDCGVTAYCVTCIWGYYRPSPVRPAKELSYLGYKAGMTNQWLTNEGLIDQRPAT